MSYLLDTNVVSEAMRPRPDHRLLDWLRAVPEDETYISVVTLAELRSGVAALDQGIRKQKLTDWLDDDLLPRLDGRIIDIDPRIAECWGDIVGTARRSGRHVQVMDAFLAATAKACSLVLATRNMRDFLDIGIQAENPWDPAASQSKSSKERP